MAICPICKSEAAALDKVGGADGFDCPSHDKFKVSDSVLATPSLMNSSRDQWEAALSKARQAQPDEWAATIKTYYF
jgi:hypothetical protein